ncbi:hypothetical protein [uncultured Dokdonia sp.]|uniref:hypothetical protein n=1 Tax=uncultured Dokdonia sp. TaxID=575653 RepID=UPI00260ED96C|nr:hypothetical protein [uncultured Dokdonia sp.]
MRLEVLSHIVIKFLIGLFMLAQSLYHIVIYGMYVSNLGMYLRSTKILNNELFQLIAPLFPFIEFALGLMLILEVYYKETMMITTIIFCSVTITYFFTDYQISNSLLMLLVSLLSIWLFVNRSYVYKHKKLSYL